MRARRSALVSAALLGALAALSGCTQKYDGDELGELTVSEAWLSDTTLGSLSFMAGGFGGESVLHVVDDQGLEHELPVTLLGNSAGFSFDANFAAPQIEIELTLPRDTVTGDQLLGRYTGSYESFVVALGVQNHHLINDSDVQLDRTLLAMGFGFAVAYEWMSILPDEEAVTDTGDTGDTESKDSADTGG